MARISQIGPGRKTTGTIDGITYVTRKGVTFARSVPNMPASAYNTPEAKKRQAIFRLIQMHMKYHLRTIRKAIDPVGNSSSVNRYYSLNCRGLRAALEALAEQYVAGEDVTLTDVENAISAYAEEHPESIRIGSKSGFQEVFLTGEWPDTITMNALEGDSTVIVIVGDNGITTTIHADGTTTVTSGTSESGSNSSNGSSGANGSNGSSGSGETGENGSSGSSGSSGSGENGSSGSSGSIETGENGSSGSNENGEGGDTGGSGEGGDTGGDGNGDDGDVN